MDDHAMTDQPVTHTLAEAESEARHEVECPSCGATIRARMADAPASSLRAELAEAQAEIARLNEERDRPYVKPGISGFVYQQPLTLDDIATALEKTLANHLGGEHGYYSPDRVGDGWLDTAIPNMAAALFDDGWTPPVVLPVAVERGQG